MGKEKKKNSFTVRLEDKLDDKLKEFCKDKGLSKNTVVKLSLELFLSKLEVMSN